MRAGFLGAGGGDLSKPPPSCDHLGAEIGARGGGVQVRLWKAREGAGSRKWTWSPSGSRPGLPFRLSQPAAPTLHPRPFPGPHRFCASRPRAWWKKPKAFTRAGGLWSRKRAALGQGSAPAGPQLTPNGRVWSGRAETPASALAQVGGERGLWHHFPWRPRPAVTPRHGPPTPGTPGTWRSFQLHQV